MVKYFKLRSEENQTNGTWINKFKYPITIDPESQIALVDIHILFDYIWIKVPNDQVVQIAFQYGSNTTLGDFRVLCYATAIPGTYSYKSFKDMIEKQLNNSIQYYGIQNINYGTGLQFKCPFRSSGSESRSTFELIYNRSDPNSDNFVTDDNKILLYNAILPNNTQIQPIQGHTGNYESFGKTNLFFVKSAGIFGCRVNNYINPGPDPNNLYKFRLGLVSIQHYDSNIINYDINQYSFCIYSDIAPDNTLCYGIAYKNIDGSNFQNLQQINNNYVTVEDNDKIQLIYTREWIVVNIVRQNGDIYPILPTHFVYKSQIVGYYEGYFGFISMFDETINLDSIVFTSDPYHKIGNNTNNYHETLDTMDITELGDIVPATARLFFPTNTEFSKDFFGYSFDESFKYQSNKGEFRAVYKILSLTFRNIMVHIDNLDLDSYSSVTQNKESIILSLNESNYALAQGVEDVAYKIGFPIWIDIKNKYPITLNQLQFRITDTNLNLIKIRNKGVNLNVIIKNKGETL